MRGKEMKKLKCLICLISLILSLSGCDLTPSITAPNKAWGYNKKIHSLSIIYLANKLGTDETQIKQSDFLKLKVAFNNANIKTDLLFYSDLDLQGAQHLSAYSKKNTYLMIINPVHMTVGETVNITYNISLYDVGRSQKIWAADLWMPYGWTKTIYQRYDEMGQLIVDKLRASNLIN
jgi:hypothetical protein